MIDKVANLTKLTANIYRCTQCYLDKKFEKFELTIGTYPYLLVLNRLEGISQNDISKELDVDKAASARAIKKLIELGYVIKEENKEDIRAYKLYITDKAKAILPEILETIHGWIDILVEGNNEERIETSMNFLEDVLQNAKKHKPGCYR
ncbi:MarR family winged helix-turn-helix transcriptional regulator [Clostridium hydrogenum]|uniref:MarR family winged helix-turn-helix transcriptional regulator n=1 Tax=Clostridium hydrogenum TaxID=2855764 RepID=UPI001F33598C|nr:MarR family transcriptional regulator [Clostridium hydrogenum]